MGLKESILISGVSLAEALSCISRSDCGDDSFIPTRPLVSMRSLSAPLAPVTTKGS